MEHPHESAKVSMDHGRDGRRQDPAWSSSFPHRAWCLFAPTLAQGWAWTGSVYVFRPFRPKVELRALGTESGSQAEP
eukprot:9497775-Pyramimonas_sp.AAC.1